MQQHSLVLLFWLGNTPSRCSTNCHIKCLTFLWKDKASADMLPQTVIHYTKMFNSQRRLAAFMIFYSGESRTHCFKTTVHLFGHWKNFETVKPNRTHDTFMYCTCHYWTIKAVNHLTTCVDREMHSEKPLRNVSLCRRRYSVTHSLWYDEGFGVKRGERVHAGADPDRKGHLLAWQRFNSPADI